MRDRDDAMNELIDPSAQLIGRRMYELRKRAGLTQAAVGEKLGKNASAVSRWEAGHLPTGNVLIQFCFAVGVEPKDLFSVLGVTDPNVDDLLAEADRRIAQVRELLEQDRLRGKQE